MGKPYYQVTPGPGRITGPGDGYTVATLSPYRGSPMRRTLFLLTLAAVLPATVVAQTPDFSGTWKINMIKSDAAPQGRGGQQMDMSSMMLTITQTAEMITIVQTGMGQELTTSYYLDGRESTNQARRGEMKSTSKWDGAKLVTNGSATFNGPNGEMTMTMKDVRELSKDGTTMTVTSTTDSPMGQRTRKTVFDKQ